MYRTKKNIHDKQPKWCGVGVSDLLNHYTKLYMKTGQKKFKNRYGQLVTLDPVT